MLGAPVIPEIESPPPVKDAISKLPDDGIWRVCVVPLAGIAKCPKCTIRMDWVGAIPALADLNITSQEVYVFDVPVVI